MKRRSVTTATASLIGGLVLAYLVYRAVTVLDWHGMWASAKAIPVRTFAGLMILQCMTLLLGGLLWAIPLSGRRRLSLRFFYTVFRVYSAAGLVESLTPSSKLGGETAKLALLKNLTGYTFAELTPTFLVIKAVSLLPMCIAVGFLASVSSRFIDSRLAGTFVLVSVAGIVYVGYYLTNQVRRERLNVDTPTMVLLLALSALMWSMYPLKFMIVARSVGIDVSAWHMSTAVFLAYGISVLPLTPGGLGTFEATMALALTGAGVSWESGLLIAGVTRVFTFGLPVTVSIYMAIELMIFAKNRPSKLDT